VKLASVPVGLDVVPDVDASLCFPFSAGFCNFFSFFFFFFLLLIPPSHSFVASLKTIFFIYLKQR